MILPLPSSISLFSLEGPASLLLPTGRPYTKKHQLIARKIIPEATYNKIKDKMITKQAAAKK
jgi:hypothetical protein